ncbi:YbaK/EbsC family protein [Enterococcus hulanensis]|uniref:YbaK/EbsC family protein n=1 Tax=Enterococcus hulanensis TaxID=2559929 RepID=A0ABU3EVS0_9ENTE|nr:YbaK/EbsC family protein [Enterococcus hulanensis]MDT2598949.1 YbaK/EbsC family protein [Enterococcus hulanensis]MDT2610600.1 YbaK/EbsC family protein [Enterococcus hulanensis]MDT2614842.1 YbaK/EbsC family protein [Enterococcus hulanensis]MDT2627188.1 YbaK/EbsC family protein [Enterococcus hulanensis]MDT2653912.1 YbaK/EbsC family protein [Enterococcus hulanensis]
MVYVSEMHTTPPTEFGSELEEKTYETLAKLEIPFYQVATGEALTMEDCIDIDNRLGIEVVKTIFLCNQKKTKFYLYITPADFKFVTKEFGKKMEIPRVSFASADLLKERLGVIPGAATIFGLLKDPEHEIQLVFDKSVAEREWYGCSSGSVTNYMKLKTADIFEKFLPYTGHEAIFIN